MPRSVMLPLLLSAARILFASNAAEMNNEGARLYAAGRFSEAAVILERALSAAERDTDSEPDLHASVANNLAAVYRGQARYNDAERLYRLALNEREALLGRDDPSLAPPLRGLSFLALDRGQLTTAVDLARRVQSLPGLTDTARAGVCNDLATILSTKGEMNEATAQALQAAQLLGESGQTRSRTYADTLNILGLLAKKRGDLTEAETRLREGAALLEQTAGPRHPLTATAYNNLGQVLGAAGRFQEAEAQFDRAISIWKAALPAGHPSLASSLTNLASLQQKQRRFDEAERLLREALAMNRAHFGSESTRVALDLNNLGSVYLLRKRYRAAVEIFEQAFAMHQRLAGASHADTGLIAGNLGAALSGLKRYADAEPYYAQAITVWEQSHSATDPVLAALLEKDAALLRLTRNFPAAEQADMRAMHIRVKNALRNP